MVRNFWKSLFGLSVVLLIFNIVSWLYIVHELKPHNLAVASSSLVLTTEAPSIWSFMSPGHTGNWFAPVIVLLVQVWLTGCFYGTLIRANTGEPVNTGTFIADGLRPFWRLLLWNLMWAALSLVVLGFTTAFGAFGYAMDGIVLLLRFGFLFADLALVAEQDVRYALQSALQSLLRSWLAMLPFAVVLIVVTSAATHLSRVWPTGAVLAVAVVYSLMMTWILHMVAARYLILSSWRDRNFINTSEERPA